MFMLMSIQRHIIIKDCFTSHLETCVVHIIHSSFSSILFLKNTQMSQKSYLVIIFFLWKLFWRNFGKALVKRRFSRRIGFACGCSGKFVLNYQKVSQQLTHVELRVVTRFLRNVSFQLISFAAICLFDIQFAIFHSIHLLINSSM